MPIVPLPVFEADADPHHREALTDREIYERLEAPKTIVVRFGSMKWVAEYRHDGDAKPGCGTKLVIRSHRGTELAEMLTTTCENAGCSKSVTRQEMLEYIENSGGRDYPFYTNGRVVRVATVEDLNRQSALLNEKPTYVRACRQLISELELAMKLVDAEPILGGELLTFYYMSEGRVDFRELVRQLAAQFQTRIEMRQVGARDEARLVADYERCGQHCCCKNFLKVLKPVSMKSAKVQKATLDTLKISGRCGRLMCCLRYEDQTYKELKANLPPRNKRVGTAEGPGIVVDTKILVQLALVRLEDGDREIAVPVEELMDPDSCPRPGAAPPPDPLRGMDAKRVRDRVAPEQPPPGEGEPKRKRRRRRGKRSAGEQQDAFREEAQRRERDEPQDRPKRETAPRDEAGDAAQQGGPRRKRRRRRRRGGRGGGGGGDGGGGGGGGGDEG